MSRSPSETTLPRRPRLGSLPLELALRVLFSPDSTTVGKVRRLSSDGIELGRGEASSAQRWSLADPMASRRHATISWDASRDAFVVTDTQSRNGTRLNGKPTQSERLRAGDILRVGDTLLLLFALDPVLEPEWQSGRDSLLCGASAHLQRLTREMRRVAPSNLTIVIEGETGTGKDVVARELHRLSGRSGPYVVVNCAAIVPSLVESELFGHKQGAFSGATESHVGVVAQAHEGTLLLDEIGELDLISQAKLLRVLEDRIVKPVGSETSRVVDVRFVCATNKDLQGAVDHGTFRADLYARINQQCLRTPALRDRPEDVYPIVCHVLSELGRTHNLHADAFEALVLHPWPFNVRELEAVIRKAVLRVAAGDDIDLAHVEADVAALEPAMAVEDTGLPRPEGEPTKNELIQVLEHFGGGVSDAARHLGRARTQLYRWLKKHSIDPSQFRR